MPKQRFAFTSLSVIIFLTSSNLVAGEGSCPKIAPLATFNTKSFVDIWWMYGVNPVEGPIRNSPCQHVKYTYVNDNELTVTEYGVNGSKTPGTGTIKQIAPGQFDVSLPRFNGVRRYEILNIDYANYFIVHNCQIVSGAPVETKVIYTRSPNPSQSVVNQALKASGLSLKDLKLTDLKNCQ